MGRALFFCALLAASIPFQMSHAADDADADDIVILSVKPRSPDVKPIAVAVSAKGQDIAAASGPADRTRPAPAGVQVSTRR